MAPNRRPVRRGWQGDGVDTSGRRGTRRGHDEERLRDAADWRWEADRRRVDGRSRERSWSPEGHHRNRGPADYGWSHDDFSGRNSPESAAALLEEVRESTREIYASLLKPQLQASRTPLDLRRWGANDGSPRELFGGAASRRTKRRPDVDDDDVPPPPPPPTAGRRRRVPVHDPHHAQVPCYEHSAYSYGTEAYGHAPPAPFQPDGQYHSHLHHSAHGQHHSAHGQHYSHYGQQHHVQHVHEHHHQQTHHQQHQHHHQDHHHHHHHHHHHDHHDHHHHHHHHHHVQHEHHQHQQQAHHQHHHAHHHHTSHHHQHHQHHNQDYVYLPQTHHPMPPTVHDVAPAPYAPSYGTATPLYATEPQESQPPSDVTEMRVSDGTTYFREPAVGGGKVLVDAEGYDVAPTVAVGGRVAGSLADEHPPMWKGVAMVCKGGTTFFTEQDQSYASQPDQVDEADSGLLAPIPSPTMLPAPPGSPLPEVTVLPNTPTSAPVASPADDFARILRDVHTPASVPDAAPDDLVDTVVAGALDDAGL